MKKISIIMPCYNGMKYISQAVESVLAQKYLNWELLVSDDGSVDGTREYLLTLNDHRIKLFFQDKNLGIFGNLNFLFSKASFEISQILCQDDFFVDDNALSSLVDTWEKLPSFVAYMRTSHGLDSKGSNLAQYEMQVLPEILTPKCSNLAFFIFGNVPGNLSNVSLKTNTVKKYGGFNQQLPYAGDFEFWSRVAEKECWAISNRHIVSVRAHPEQASYTLNQKGELVIQLRYVVERIYHSLLQQGFNPLELKLMATISYISLHRDAGLKKLVFKKDVQYIRLVSKHLDQAPFSLGVWLSWIIYFLSIGGRVLRVTIAKLLFASKFQKINQSS